MMKMMNKELIDTLAQKATVVSKVERVDMIDVLVKLVVDECAAQCWAVSESEHKGYVVSECGKRIRKHFGVEV